MLEDAGIMEQDPVEACFIILRLQMLLCLKNACTQPSYYHDLSNISIQYPVLIYIIVMKH